MSDVRSYLDDNSFFTTEKFTYRNHFNFGSELKKAIWSIYAPGLMSIISKSNKEETVIMYNGGRIAFKSDSDIIDHIKTQPIGVINVVAEKIIAYVDSHLKNYKLILGNGRNHGSYWTTIQHTNCRRHMLVVYVEQKIAIREVDLMTNKSHEWLFDPQDIDAISNTNKIVRNHSIDGGESIYAI